MKKTGIRYSIESARSGDLIVVADSAGRSVPLNSRLDPLREGGRADYELSPDRYSLLIILGCAMGYHLIKYREEILSYKKVIIIDILPGIEEHLPGNELTSYLCLSDNINFYSGLETERISHLLREEIDFSGIMGIQVIEHSASVRVFSEYYKSIKNTIKGLIDREARNSSTVKAFGSLFLRNAINNIKNFNRVAPVATLKNSFKGERALIISSAPSIESYIDRIRHLNEFFYIIAVDSALPLLSAEGIVPDFVISIDPQQRILEHFAGGVFDKSTFIFSIVSNPELLSRYGGFISLNSHPVSQVIDDLFPDITGSVDSGTGSVAGDALSFAVYAGFKYIGMAGFDFSFSSNRIYARGTAYQTRYSRFFNNRFVTPEGLNAAYIFRSSSGFMQQGIYTRKSFVNYRDSLQLFIKNRGLEGITFINSGGLRVEGVNYSDLDAFVPAGSKMVTGYGNSHAGSVRYSSMNSFVVIDKLLSVLSDENTAYELVKVSLGRTPDEKDMKKFYSLIRESRFRS